MRIARSTATCGCCLRRSMLRLIGGAIVAVALAVTLPAAEWVSGIPWPEPPLVAPGRLGGPPGDAIVLFDGKDLSPWTGGNRWKIEDGCAIAAHGSIHTKQAFGDCQLHIEWAAPAKVRGSGQGRGNSGAYLMGLYELQILDSHNNPTYVDGQAAAIYKQHPPLVNASRKPGEWQTYDIIFEAPRFNGDKLVRPAFMTVLHNGVLVQNHYAIQGETSWEQPPKYTPHASKLPLTLQFHSNPVRFRNIWIRELPPSDAPPPAKGQQTDSRENTADTERGSGKASSGSLLAHVLRPLEGGDYEQNGVPAGRLLSSS